MKYAKLNQAAKYYGVHFRTILNWSKSGKIKTIKLPSGNTQYELIDNNIKTGIVVGYVRVSSYGQKEHLKSQTEVLLFKCPNAQIITEVGSGLNFKRKKLWDIMEQVFTGNIRQIVVTHKDRLSRFGFDFIKKVCEYFGTEILVLNQIQTSPQEELVQDILAIIHVFSSRLYGLRKYKTELKSLQNDIGQKSGSEASKLECSM